MATFGSADDFDPLDAPLPTRTGTRMTGIQWTQRTWNPTTGCDKISPGCDTCYALTMARRLKGMGQAKYQRDGDPVTSGPGFGLTVHPDAVNLPLRWRKPSVVFVNSMSDLFHHEVPAPWVADVFAVMAAARQHAFQVLTKRPSRARHLLTDDEFVAQIRDRAAGKGLNGWTWPIPNVHLGTSTEDQRHADTRIPHLIATPAAVRFISAEPLIGPINLFGDVERPGPATVRTGVSYPTDYGTGIEYDVDDQPGLDWVIVGGESGPGARPMDLGWVRDIRDQCTAAGVALFVKQMGSVWARANDLTGKGGDPDTWPADLRIREMPATARSAAA